MRLIFRSLRFHSRANLGVALGAALATTVLTGAMLVGDSVRVGLARMAHARLGETDCALVSPDRLFRADLATRLGGDPATPPADLPWLGADAREDVPPARSATRALASDWWVYSFTQLAHAEGADPLAAATQADPGGEDEAPASDADLLPDAAVTPLVQADPRFSGSRFGVVMHAALENADFAAWRDWQPGDPAPDGQAEVIVQALREVFGAA